MDSKTSNLGLNNGVPPSALTGEQELALFHKNGMNHPVTRLSEAQQALDRRQAKDAQSKTD